MTNTTDAGLPASRHGDQAAGRPIVDELREKVRYWWTNWGDYPHIVEDIDEFMAQRDAELDALIARARADGEAAGRERINELEKTLKRLQEWDMNYVDASGKHTGADTADGPWARELIRNVLAERPSAPDQTMAEHAHGELRHANHFWRVGDGHDHR